MSPARSFYDIINLMKGGTFMKRVLSVIICVLSLSFLVGCTSDSSEVTDINGNAKSSFNVNETAVYEDVHYTVTNVEYSNGDEYDNPADGNNYVVVTVKIENKSDEKISYNALDWQMINSDGQEDSETFTTIDSDTNLNSGDLVAGGTKTGTIVFEESKDATSLKLNYYSNVLFDDEGTIEFIIK